MFFKKALPLALVVALTFAGSSAFASTAFQKSSIATPVSIGNGGTGLTSITQGFTLFASGADTLSATSNIFVEAGGNVGIGTTAPQGLLDIRGSLCLNGGADCRTTWPTSGDLGSIDGTGTANYLPKFSDSDTLANSAIFDSSGNVGIGTTSPEALLQINSSATPSDNQIKVTANGAGSVATLAYAVDNLGIFFDAEWDSSQWKSTDDGSSFGVYKNTDLLRFMYDTVAVGGGISWNNGMVMNVSGNIGIGTTAPGAKLAVHSSQVAVPTFRLKGIADQTADFFQIKNSADSQLLTVDSSGNIGIGTTEPGAKLQVESATNNILTLIGPMGAEEVDTAIIRLGSTIFRDDENFPQISAYRDGDNHQTSGLRFKVHQSTDASVASITAMTIDKDGNVGIGTTGPGTKLEVAGTGAIRSTWTGASSAGVGGTLQLAQDDGAALESGHRMGVVVFGASEDASNTLHYGGAINSYASELWSSTQNGTELAFETTLNGAISRTERMRITSSGNIGIGTTNPGAKLQVAGIIQGGVDGTTQGQLTLWSTTASAEGNIYGATGGGMLLNTNANAHPIQIDGSKVILGMTGNVGIGTTSPGAALSIKGNTSEDQLRITDSVSYFYKIGRNTSNGLLTFQGTQAGFTGYNFKSDDGISLIKILDNGNIGIGTTNPTEGKLVVDGKVTCADGSGNYIGLMTTQLAAGLSCDSHASSNNWICLAAFTDSTSVPIACSSTTGTRLCLMADHI